MVADVKSFLRAETDFGLDMLRKLSLNESNVVSPLSVIFALNILQPGAKGRTKTQIIEAISKGSTDDDTVKYYSNLMQEISDATNDVQCKIANAFFVRNGVEIKDDYADKITKMFCAKLQSHDFSQADKTAKVINDFVDESTAGKIKKIVKTDSIQGAVSIIVNAIYFKAEWDVKSRFSHSNNGKFYSAPEREREVEYMRHYADTYFLYAEDDDAQVLSLLYKDETYAFNIILPKSRFGLEELVRNWSGERVQNLLTKLKDTFITAVIPKMKIETEFGLEIALRNMGIKDMFSGVADFSGISNIPLSVSSAVHKALIEVDEEGTTAAAATALMLGSGRRTAEPVQFIADHPFLFVLTKDNNPLFMGVFA